MNEQPEKIILLPPTHEQSTPSFHVMKSLAVPFQAFLQSHGITAWQPPELLDKPAHGDNALVEIGVEADTPQDCLEALLAEFLENR